MGTLTVIAIVTSSVCGVCYTALALLVVVGLRISRPTVSSHLYGLVRWMFGAALLGVGLHYLHLGYYGATNGILPSQQTIFAATSNLIQALALPPMLAVIWYLRLKMGAGEARGD